MKNTETQYGPLAKGFHWIVAALIFFQIPLAWVMTELPKGPQKLEYFALHKSLGFTVFALVALRAVWRLISPPPPLPPAMPRWQKLAAHGTHAVLYFCLLVMPITGWIVVSTVNSPVSYFGLFTLPNIVAPNRELHEIFEEVHEGFAIALITAFSLHIIGALYHHYVQKDVILRRMIPFIKAE